MANSPITSFTMAVILALWSPGSCCCGVFGEEVSSSACAGRTAPGSQQESTATHEARGDSLATRSSPEDDRSSCVCITQTREANLVRAAVPLSSTQTDLLILDALAWTPALIVPGIANFGLRARTARAGPGLPCADSLLMRHCLLTI